MASSSAVSAGDLATADQFNALRSDILDGSSGHDHDGTDGNATLAATALGTLTALTVDDVAIDGKVVTMTGSSSDTAVFTAGTNGTLSIVTTDAAAAAANIQMTADGTVDIDSAGLLTLDSGAAINIEPASGSAILLDGTISIDAGVVTGATSITSTAFVGDITGDVTGTADTATVATTVTITDNESTNEENAVVFTAGGDVDGGNIGLESDGTLTYNPSSGTVTATIFKGNIDAVDGDFDGTLEADALTVGGTNVLTGSLITTLGTISAGVWNGTAITGAYINDDIISGQSEITSGLAAADELLYSDAGTVKRVGIDTLTTYLAGVNAGTVTSTGLSDSSGVITLDIQNMTASTTIADADLVVIDDGAGGTLRKMTRANFIESAALDAINIDGGAIDGAVIGANSAAAGTFAALVATTGTFSGTVALGTQSLTFSDITLSRGAANRLDLATGDSLKIVNGNILFPADNQELQGGSAATTDSLGWAGGDLRLNTRQHIYLNVDSAGAHGQDAVIIGHDNTNTSATAVIRLDELGHIKIGGTANHGTTTGTSMVTIFNGTAPVGTVSNGASIYTASGEMYTIDASGNTFKHE